MSKREPEQEPDQKPEQEPEQKPNRQQPRRQWTLMFYFASDNPLAPGVVSQLKALLNAGYQKDVNVIARFDPATVGTPTQIFEVNLVEKVLHPGQSNIGFARDELFVRSLLKDKLWMDGQKDRKGKPIREEIAKALGAEGIRRAATAGRSGTSVAEFVYNPPEPPADKDDEVADEGDTDSKQTKPETGRGLTEAEAGKDEATGAAKTVSPQESGKGSGKGSGPGASLRRFLKFCADYYPADHYILFILGHGIVVGNDVFLFDQHAQEPTLSLTRLRDILTEFKKDFIKVGEFELVSFHSCSVSSLEVAYELKGTANYMLASQGSAFVGSWPYRQILMRIFKDAEANTLQGLDEKGRRQKIKEMLIKIFYYCLYNSGDFLLAGYSFDICLCSLDEAKVTDLTTPLKTLTDELRKALQAEKEEDRKINRLATNFILLSHLKSQSFWQESYTDLYDFCFCLSGYCEAASDDAGNVPAELTGIYQACGGVMKKLVKEASESDDNFIVRAEFAGPESQYSHGMSVFFPWTEPSLDNPIWPRPHENPPVKGQYAQYKFEETGWRLFLQDYFDLTKRKTRNDEYDPLKVTVQPRNGKPPILPQELLEDIASLAYSEAVRSGAVEALGNGAGGNSLGKDTPPDPTGDSCTCPSIKNYPRDTRPLEKIDQRKGQQKGRTKSSIFGESYITEQFK